MIKETAYDLYERLASIIFDVPLEEVSKKHRSKTKKLIWSWAYTMRTSSEELQDRYEELAEEMENLRNTQILCGKEDSAGKTRIKTREY